MFIIYTSSAGSGKTYTLSKEYLRLALGVDPQSSTFNPQYFRKILAITFTKDAAKEMKQRVLGKLLAFTENKDLFLQQELCQALGISLQELQQRAKLVFQQVIYHYSDFAVSTIDSFNNRLIAAFTQEINIPMNYQLDMDVESLTNNAADRLIAQLGEKDKEEITEFVLNFVIDEIREGSSWKDLHKKLSEYTKNLYKEESRPIAHKISQRKLKDYSSVIADLKSFLKVFKRSLKVKKEAFLEIIADNHLKLDDFSQGSKGLPTFINKLNLLEAGKLDKDLFNSYVLSMFKEQKWYAQKSKKASIIDGISEDLGIILRAIYDEWEENKERFFLIQSTLQEFYKLALTAEIHSVVEETKLKNNVLYISEINEKIAQIIQNEPIPFIYERLGEKYNHLLIDEFQDTSVLQWHNLLPLIENNLANGHFNLIVGDAKQAIYRWRGGEMEQIVHLAYARDEQIGDESIQRLQEMAKAYFYHNEDEAQENLASRYELIQTYIEKKNLATNYRSDAKIITFNNHFFAKIVDKISVEHPFAEKIYDGFKQEIPEKASNKGVVEIRLLEKEADKSYDLLMQEEILTIVKRSLERGFSAKDIAILFRTGDKARKIATLLKEKGFQIVSADSLVLAAEPKVNFLIAMLKTIDNPDNKLAKSEALYLLHTAILEEIPLQEQSDAIRQAVYSKNASNAAFVSYIQEKGYDISWNYLQSLGLYDLLTELIFIFKVVEKHPKNLEFVFKLQDWAMEFSRTKSNHINDFIIEWNKKKDSIAVEMPEADAITITTIHKSKGLEYPIVILPYADWGTKAKYYESIWVDSEGLDFPIQQPEQLPSHLLIRMKDNPAEKIKKFQDKNNEKSILENLNLLYVAFTRAVDGLYILSRKSGKENTITRWITLFVQNLDAEMSPDFQEDNKRYHFGFEENFSRTQSNEEEACIFHLENLALQSVQKKLL